MHKHRIYHKGSFETFSCKIIKWLQIVLLSYGDFYTLIRDVRKTLIYSHLTIYSKIKYNKNPNNNIKSTHPNFSYFLNHIQSLISKTLIYLQQITNTVSKLLKTVYIYIYIYIDLQVHDFLISQTTNTITKNSLKKSWILRWE